VKGGRVVFVRRAVVTITRPSRLCLVRSIRDSFEFTQIGGVDHRHDSYAQVDAQCIAVEERKETHGRQHDTTRREPCTTSPTTVAPHCNTTLFSVLLIRKRPTETNIPAIIIATCRPVAFLSEKNNFANCTVRRKYGKSETVTRMNFKC